MFSNREISRLFGVYAELLLLHKKEERLANLLSGASYRLRRMDEPVMEMTQQQWTELFRPEIIVVLQELCKVGRLVYK